MSGIDAIPTSQRFEDFGPAFLKKDVVLSPEILDDIQQDSPSGSLGQIIPKALEYLKEIERLHDKISKDRYIPLLDSFFKVRQADSLTLDLLIVRVNQLQDQARWCAKQLNNLRSHSLKTIDELQEQIFELEYYIDQAKTISDSDKTHPNDILVLSRRMDTMNLIKLSKTYNIEQIKLSLQNIGQALLRYREFQDFIHSKSFLLNNSEILGKN